MVEDNQFQIEQRQKKEKESEKEREGEREKGGERKRVMEEGRETDWTGEMGGKEEGRTALSNVCVYECVCVCMCVCVCVCVCVVTFDLCRVTFKVGVRQPGTLLPAMMEVEVVGLTR